MTPYACQVQACMDLGVELLQVLLLYAELSIFLEKVTDNNRKDLQEKYRHG